MKSFILVTILAIIFINTRVHAQVLAYEFVMDTVMYKQTAISNIFPSPLMAVSSQRSFLGHPSFYTALQKKGTNICDIFSMTGKVGTISLPEHYFDLIPSQKFIDDDDGWEYIAVYNDNITSRRFYFQVVDDDGSVLLADDGGDNYIEVFYGFDGSNTYVIKRGAMGYKAWSFRTNISSLVAPSLSKAKVSSPQPMMTFGSSGNYQISLQPAESGKTTVQLFDFLGRVVFNKTIDNVTKPVTYSIPERELPNSPFIAKIKNSDGSTVKREISVR